MAKITSNIDKLNPQDFILIKGAKEHNLQNIDVAIPRDKFVVITGLSGSGKSSLAFDTLYAEGQRRYVESLSSYARQFLGKIDKPAVDYIKGISPAVAIEQKTGSSSSRSTVGTSTEIYDYLKLLFARIGRTISPISGKEVKRNSPADVFKFIHKLEEGTKIMLSAQLTLRDKETVNTKLQLLQQQGFSRVIIKEELQGIADTLKAKPKSEKNIHVLIDRFAVKHDDENNQSRIVDSIELAYFEGNNECFLHIVQPEKTEIKSFSNRFEADGIQFEIPSDYFFSFNNPVGACKTCEGLGSVIGIDPDLVIPDKSRSVFDGAVMCWKGEKMSKWKDDLVAQSHKFEFPIHKPISELSQKQSDLLWEGNKHFKGINAFFKMLEENSYKIQYRVMLSRYRGKTSCPDCKGTRLRKDANYVKINGKSITDIILTEIKDLPDFFENLKLSENEGKISKRILTEIITRIGFLNKVGLGYLQLNRLASTLSGGETQRINLATSLGSSLVGSMYILDEPSIGLHPRDTEQLVSVLRSLQTLGNTVVVVEHEEEVIREADMIIDLGPLAGTEGGQLVFQGSQKELQKETKSLTARYMTGKESIELPKSRRAWKKSIQITGASEHNLKSIDVEFPLNTLSVITGVSGSGKSTLMNKILYPVLKKLHGGIAQASGKHTSIDGDIKSIGNVEYIDQHPIGKSSRSNPVTYIKAFDEIRTLFSNQSLAKMRGYKPASFSFNVEGGRCEKCKGDGTITVEMQFMPDIQLKCDVCDGKRFTEDILEVQYRTKNVSDVLTMTIDDAIVFFNEGEERISQKIGQKLLPLQEVGLGYVQLGQASNTLSGGEAQRIKLASFLLKGQATSSGDKTLFIFDEPTTGLHFHDIKKLLKALNALVDLGHSIIVVEHNLDVIKCADWIIDLGPEGGNDGGHVVFKGTPEQLLKNKKSYTAKYLKERLNP